MSRGPGQGRGRGLWLAEFVARILAPTAAALALLAMVTGSARQIDQDLRVVAPERATAGQPLPVRAQLYANLHRPRGAELVIAKVALELRSMSGRLLARTWMRASYARSLDTVLVPPKEFQGEARLMARARVDGKSVSSERVLELTDAGHAQPQPLYERPLGPLQRLVAGPLRVVSKEQAPNALTLAIVGGVCVPEQACEFALHVGAPAAAVRVLPTPSVSPDAASARLSEVTAGVVRLRAVTHGPEAELRVVAERDGVEVATRAFRLAVALGASAARELPRVFDAPARPKLGLRGDEQGCIVDAFRERQWLRTGALRDCRDDEPLPFAPLSPGLWRLQLRRDPFASDTAAVISLYVRHEAERAPEVLRRLASAVLEYEPHDKFARTVQRDPETWVQTFEHTASYLLAQLDSGIIALPAPVSGYPLAMLRLEVARATLRKLALVALILCALSLGLLVAQRGLAGVSEADRVMAEAGEDAARLDRQHLRRTLRVLATVASLLLAFAAIAVYVVARSQAP